MLDTQTKKRIDDCRDILVGKLPDPKAQIEQITIGLIYKFMDDMDKEAIELGGSAKFFSGDYVKYSWDALFDTKVTAAEMLKLYSEAIESMEKNPNIPQLFRDIFNNAYLPYRDPETLKLFLKTIGEFEYTHSEKLGDAFEYLLSVMGSQGDAGQFRTPRHIIDFLVAMVDPKKTDTILDPACGTAGFLISAFKHIKAQNHNKLTPDEQKRLIQNFVGYDISPDMVRLSLVNLYLHGFANPHISEYDTLSSEERWNDNYDVVLANPPFMSPKGGIRPHKKFTIKSNRSEVLFVDYIAEHLNPKGRAGIIVPEGVIFQSGTAYKDLRKMLVDNYLYAVVSLPAGVFNPYSGVKTSILLMDAAFAKTSNEILFVKIDNDGFNLGAQRTAVKGGQLTEAIELLNQFKNGEFSESKIAHSVLKTEICSNGEYNLSGERYKALTECNTEFAIVELGDVAKFQQGTQVPKEDQLTNESDGYERFIRIVDYTQKNDDIRYIPIKESNTRCNKDDVIMVRYGEVGFVGKGIRGVFANNLFSITPILENLSKDFLFQVFKSVQFKSFVDRVVLKSSMPAISHKVLKDFKFPLPPLSVQEEIVAEIESYQKIIDGAKMVVENYKPKIDIDSDWEMVDLQEVCNVTSGGTPDRKNDSYWNGNIPYVKTGEIYFNKIASAEEFITEEGLKNSSTRLISPGTILMAMYGQGVTRGRVAILEIEAAINQAVAAISSKNGKITTEFLFYQLQGLYEYLRMISDARGGNQSNLNAKLIKELKIVVPSLEIQNKIVSQIGKELELVNANKHMIEIFEQKIKDRIAKVWGEEKTEKEQEFDMAAEPETEYKTN
ncbi:MAG: N-6 DNA methylase [Prolixibacteraceae bacterium]|jgi:type I restriction enzyme M protein|nr:N-6 DNA methylase [Prolixibacteraceae bacterium]